MKTIVIFFLLFSSFSTKAQFLGGLMVQSYSNITNNLADNHNEDSTMVRIINKSIGIDTTVSFSKANKYYISLKSGLYTLFCTVGVKTIELKDVRVSNDKIIFVDVLFEPKAKLNFVERRKRKKLYFNFS